MFQAKDFITPETNVTDFAARPVSGGRPTAPRPGEKRPSHAPRPEARAAPRPTLAQGANTNQPLAQRPAGGGDTTQGGAEGPTQAGGAGGKHRRDASLPPQGPMAYRHLPKRLLDIFLVVMAAPAALPLVLVLAALVMLDGASPFYRQRRLGRGGTGFALLKLRTMRPGAEAALASYLAANPAACQEWQAKQKLRHDPRVTRVGRWLRKSSLDELPQLWNVLRGDMSLVGPRPMMPDQRGLHPEPAAYDALRPGITGMWQVSERNDAEFRMRGLYDRRYDCEVSLGTDLAILLRTIAVVLRGTGC